MRPSPYFLVVEVNDLFELRKLRIAGGQVLDPAAKVFEVTFITGFSDPNRLPEADSEVVALLQRT